MLENSQNEERNVDQSISFYINPSVWCGRMGSNWSVFMEEQKKKSMAGYSKIRTDPKKGVSKPRYETATAEDFLGKDFVTSWITIF